MNNSNFYVPTICRFFEGGPGANVSYVFLLNTAVLRVSDDFLQLNNLR